MANPGKYLEFTIVKNPLSSYYDDPEYIKSGNVLSLSISSFTTRQIEVQIELSNPIYVSIDAFHRDQLKVRIVDESTFVSAIDFITTAKRHGTAQIEIARFLSNEIKSVVENLQKQQTTINAFVTGSLPINIVLGLSLKYLGGMVNSLQFVIFMDQWKVNWPPNASMAIKTVRTVALAEFIDTKKVEQKVFDFYGLNQTHKESPGRRLEVT
jgi:flagellar hook-basal body complex protein FliE